MLFQNVRNNIYWTNNQTILITDGFLDFDSNYFWLYWRQSLTFSGSGESEDLTRKEPERC